ncbi:hypothetical protein AWB79_01049 [Caballeronia hypogeia]|uniref:Uncharacterized protein n=1 Tax=Caballeronia hypogeia TaxID=1777140 RepID=A0A157ZK88_9BURK|nr:hypothetical protein [Caballeronia hypogeia]SAK45859.1 hypothetical protein AWB79_01049 [Caballeronia hypogeia]
MELSETVGSRDFTATLALNGLLVLKEGHREVLRGTLCDALAAVGERPEMANLETTVEDMLRAFIRAHARVT